MTILLKHDRGFYNTSLPAIAAYHKRLSAYQDYKGLSSKSPLDLDKIISILRKGLSNRINTIGYMFNPLSSLSILESKPGIPTEVSLIVQFDV